MLRRVGICGLGVALVALAPLVAAPPVQADDAFAWDLVEEATPRFAWINVPLEVRLRIRNEGTETWRPELLDNVAYHWYSASGELIRRDGRRTRLPHPVPPGGEVEVVVVVDPFPEPGARVLEWDLVRESVTWFGPPRRPGRERQTIFFLTRMSLGILELTLGIGLAAVVLRVFRRPRSFWWWLAAVALPPLFAAFSGWVVTVGFAELSGLMLWPSERTMHLSGCALLAVPALLAPGRSRPWVAGASMLLTAVVCTADLIYMQWFGSLVPLSALAAAHQVGQIGGSIRALFAPRFAWMVALVVPALVMIVAWPRYKADEIPPRRTRAVAWLVLALLWAAALKALVRDVVWSLQDPGITRLMFSQQQRVRQWGVLNLHLLDACIEVAQLLRHPELSPADRQRIAELFDARAASAAPPGQLFGIARRRNLLLVQVESLQAWVVGARVGGVAVMPTLASLVSDGRCLFFSNVFDQSAQGRSSDGEFAALNSMLPRRSGAVAFLNADGHFLALPEVLRGRGYATFSAHPFERGFWNRAVLHPRYGFEASMFQRDLGPGEQIGWGLADGLFFSRALPAVAALPRPFFAHLITLGLHHPFDLFPDRHKVLEIGDLAGTPLGNYLHAMHYFDASLAELLHGLEEQGLADSTVVALYGDHESGLAIQEGVLRVTGIPSWDPSLPARLKKVPVLVMLPGRELTGVVDVVGGHVDIAPTLLYLLGVERPRSFLGTALMPGRGGVTAQPNGSAISDSRIFVATGARIPDGGACFAFPSAKPLPRDACDMEIASAQLQLDVADLVIEHDLFREIAGSGGR